MYFVAGALSGPIPVEIVIAVLFIAFQDQDVGLLTFVLSRLIVRVITTAAGELVSISFPSVCTFTRVRAHSPTACDFAR